MVSLVNSHTNATGIRWHLCEIELRFAPGLTPGWCTGAGARGVLSRRGDAGDAVLKTGGLVYHSTLGLRNF